AISSYPEPNLQIRVLYERARLRKNLGEDDEALAELKQAFDRIPENETHPGKAPVYAELAELLAAYGLGRQARALMDQALTHPEENPREAGRRFLQAALAAQAGGDWNRAAEYFGTARHHFSSLKDLNSLIWTAAHGVRLPLAERDGVQARRELKALVSRNRRFQFHTDLLLLLELELWLESGQTLRASPEFLLDQVKLRAPDWLGKGCFCDLAWPQAKTSRLLERVYQKLKRYPEAMRFAAQAKKWEEAVGKKLEALGYSKDSVHPGTPSLVSVTSVKMETVLPESNIPAEDEKKGGEELQVVKAHANYLEGQIHNLEGVKEGLLRDNLKLNREIEVLKDQLAFTQEKAAEAVPEPAKSEPEVSKPPPAPATVIESRPLPKQPIPVFKPKETKPAPVPPESSAEIPSDDGEKERLLKALSEAQGNRSQAAKVLGIHRRTLLQKLKKYGLEDLEFLPGKEAMEAAMAEANGNRSEAAKKLGMSRSSFYRRLKELGLG
ncbi:MAG: helix-turn-helix domain-containing protein, partial [Actinomycetota bacterium]